MHKSGSSDKLGAHGAHSRRKSLFTLSALTQINTNRDDAQREIPTKMLRKKKTPSLFTNLEHPEVASIDTASPMEPSQSPKRSQMIMRGGRPSSVFGSLRSMRSTGDDDAPLTTTSTKSSLHHWSEVDGGAGGGGGGGYSKNVLHHGEVQTSSSMFRKKKEYLVLTETHLVRCKNQGKASETFVGVPPPLGRTPTVRHGSMPSFGSSQDLQSVHSDSSGDKEGRIPLRQVVAVHRLDDGRPYFAIEVDYLDDESGQASALTLQSGDPEDRDIWLQTVRAAANRARFMDGYPISAFNSRNAARTVERDNDYDPHNYAIYKVVQRQSTKSGGRSSTDDLSKVASTVCFLAIGIHKVHIIPLVKATSRSSSPSLGPNSSPASYGILTMMSLYCSGSDDSIELVFRQPMQRPKTLYLASLASYDIAIKLHHAENVFRPEYGYRIFQLSIPAAVEDQLLPPVDSEIEEHNCLDRTLVAHCIAYNVNAANIQYTVKYDCEDAPRFELLPPADPRHRPYNAQELLAIMRALRYNESFGSMSFANVRLDCLNGVHDNYGSEHVCSKTKRGTPIKLTEQELGRSCLLVQEIRALAATSKKLRRMDFSGCLMTKPPASTDDESQKRRDIGCGIVEALFPLCKHQTTNVDWITLNGITLSETDLDYLVGAAVEKYCHLRALELARCGLTDRSLGMILDALRCQDNTLEAIDISGNLARLSPAGFDSQISVFGFIRKLSIANMARTSGSEALLPSETLLNWRLEELRLSGTAVNAQSLEALCIYLRSPRSDTLHELYLDQTYLTGGDVASLMRAMTRHDQCRSLHLVVSQNRLTKDHDQLATAIASSLAPSHLTMRFIEYEHESMFREMVLALAINKSIRYLDFSRASLPCDASTETCQALERMFAENNTLEELDISGEDSRLEISKIGVGINRALNGLKHNKAIAILRIQHQKLGLQGASTLADVLKENSTLREIHCEDNEIPLSGLTDLINALPRNTSIVYLPSLDEARAEALKQTEHQVKQIRDERPPSSSLSSSSAGRVSSYSFGASSSAMRRSFANVKRNVGLTASAHTPSFSSYSSNSNSAGSNKAPPRFSSPFSPSSSASSPSSPKARSKAPSLGTVTTSMPQLSDQDIQAALRLVAESWDRQQFRLQQYLARNYAIMQGIPTAMEIEEEDFERPGSVGSLGKALEKVAYESTPRNEKEFELGRFVSRESDEHANGIGGRLEEPQRQRDDPAGFKRFLLGSADTSPEEERNALSTTTSNESIPSADGGFPSDGLETAPETPTPTQTRTGFILD
ncbi:hypothetical protein LTR50_001417 [Elasticomyces elasticus]|nr:hypothetical protein LTR50_001417 [Elasticomyces elasticus]